MQFKHPELLYALFLLLIPIIIHLFQLRKFQKVAFTNVAFLKKVSVETRKSSQIKKWITLLLRLLAMASIIIAFAQPFTASKTALNSQKETVIYLDNSFSMQAKGQTGPLLQRAIQQLYDNSGGTEPLSWFTNTKTSVAVSPQDFKAAVLEVPYSARQLSNQEVLLKANQLFTDDDSANKRLLFISDFQSTQPFAEIPDAFTVEAVQLEPESYTNISIDTAYIANRNGNTIQLRVGLSAQGDVPESVPVSLFDQNTLIAKSAVDFSETKKNTVSFDFENNSVFKGMLSITDPNLGYDNTLFFSINAPKKIKVLSLSGGNADFLQRIFENPEFEYTAQAINEAEYNLFATQNFIILNELKEIPGSLATALLDFVNKGGSLCIIPSGNAVLAGYNDLLGSLGMGSYSSEITQEKKITQIVFSHPLYQDVFEKQIINFQYPKVNQYYPLSTNNSAALRFEDGKPFIVQNGTVSVSTAAFNTDNSNFKNSPLIVPTLYNMAQQSLPITRLYYHTGTTNTYAIPIQLKQDEIVRLRDSLTSFVPRQQSKANQVIVTTTDDPSLAGNYQIEHEDTYIEDVSYNFDRKESTLQYLDVANWDGARTYDSIDELFDTLAEENTINSFWKWFVIFAIGFLLLEMLVLKFYKR